MIDIIQWRASIGVFNNVHQSSKSIATMDNCFVTFGDMYYQYAVIWFVSVYCLVNVYYYALCLILSGDIETNPGPVYKVCPECDSRIHIKKNVCLCGYVLCKKSRSFTKVTSPSISTANVETSNAYTQKAGCALLSTSPNDVTDTSLDPSTSVGLLGDTAHNVSSNTTIGEKLNDSYITAITEDITVKSHVTKDSLSQPSKGSAKWARRSAVVNEKRRLKYKINPKGKRLSSSKHYHSQPNIRSQQVLRAYHLNPSPAKKRMLDAYHANPSPIRQRVMDVYHANPSPVKSKGRDAYHANPSPIKRKTRDAYNSNPSPIKHKAREAYHANPSPIKRRVKSAYHANPSPIKRRVKSAYHANPSPIKRRVLDAYHRHPSPVKQRALSAYKANPSPIKRQALEAYYKEHDLNKGKKRQLYKDNQSRIKKLDKRRISKLVACSISKKYSKMRGDVPLTITAYISRVLNKLKGKSYASKHLEAQNLVNSCLQYKEMHKSDFIKQFHRLRSSVLAVLSKASEATSESQIHDVLCGQGFHTSSTESYFPSTTYNAAAFDEDGNLLRNQFPSHSINTSGNGTETWQCSSELCCIPSKSEVNQVICDIYAKIAECDPSEARYFIQHMDDCTKIYMHDAKLQGHNKACHVDPDACGSKLLYLRWLAPHYPNLRRIINILYTVRRSDSNLCAIDRALQAGNVDALEDIVKKNKQYNRKYSVPCNALDESKIRKDFTKAMTLFNERNLEHAEYPCISCTVLCFKRQCTKLDACKKPITGILWQQLLDHYEANPPIDDGLPVGYICNYCLGKFRAGVLPPRCILNGLSVGKVPAEIVELNQYEKVLIQRAKAFQVVTKMSTVAGKRLPPSHMISKVRGSTFHLPLPLQETLKCLPTPDQPIPEHGELYILLRSIPTAKNVVWQDLVDINKVYKALLKLQEINPLYHNIQLPVDASSLNLHLAISEHVSTDADASSEVGTDEDKPVTEDCDKNDDENDDKGGDKDPMVRKIEKEEEADMYKNYTIQALHAPRENEKATDLYQLLRITESAMDNRCKQLDMLCFPDLFPFSIGGLHHTRDVKLDPSDYVKTIIQSRDPRFRLNQQFLFFHFHQLTIRQLGSGIYHKLKIIRPHEKLTVARYLDMLQNEEIEGNLTSIFSRLRNSEQYWIKPRNDLNCMTLYYGPATWFLTLSPSEWTWNDMGEYLRKVNPHLKHLLISELVAADPVSVSRFMENKRKAFIDFIMSEDNPIGKVAHYYCRREYQGRGLQHFHFAIWIQGAPVLGQTGKDHNSEDETICNNDSEATHNDNGESNHPGDDTDDTNLKDEDEKNKKKVIQFISKYISCQIPDKNLSPILHDRVTKYQQHHCNKYCMRSKKTKAGIRKVCRFGFPRPERDSFCLRSVVESVAGRKALKANSRLYDLPRTAKERMINDYNPAVLLVWQGNMDIQYIGEKSAILNWYITKYTTKAEKGHCNAAYAELTSTKSLSSRLWNVALRSLSNRECGALEVSDALLGIQLYETDRETVFRWVDVNIIRSRRVKDFHTVSGLPADSEDLFHASWVDTYYPNRPTELEDTTLYDFVAWYDLESKEPKSSVKYFHFYDRYLKKRTRPYLVNHYRYNPNQDAEKYFYSILLLFKPWRQCDSLLGDDSNYMDAFNACKDSLLDGLKYHAQLSRLQEADTTVRELISKRREQMEAEDMQSSDIPVEGPLRYVATEVHNAMADFEDLVCHVNPEDIQGMIGQLNEDQLRVFNKVKTAIEAQVSTGVKVDSELCRLFISGCGGTGKSFLIKTIRAWVQLTTGKDVIVAAPTGIAARNVNGLTIHGILALPVEHGSTPPYRPLSDDALKIVREKLHNVIMFIVDEISMVSNVTLLYMHLRLSEIFQTEEVRDGWFGQQNLLFLGDLLQLPPVFEGPVYSSVSSELAAKLTGSVGTVDLWQNLFSYDELTINMRQKDEKEFVAILSRIRLGYITKEDVSVLENRKISLSSDTMAGKMKEVVQTLSTLPNDTVCLLPTRHMCNELNKQVLENLPGKEIELHAIDTVDCPAYLRQKVSKKLIKYSNDSTLTASLEKVIVIKVGCKIMLRRNIDVSNGLVNGAIGTISSVKYSIDQSNIVDSITIKFDDGKEHTLEKVNNKFQVIEKAFVIRQQFPISSAYAITVHKSQGLTLHNVLVDVGNNIFACGQAYVAISRVTSLSGLYLINFDPHCIKALDSAVIEYNYLRKTFRPTLPLLASHKKRPKVVPDKQWCMTKYATLIQQQSAGCMGQEIIVLPNKGFRDPDGFSSYANTIMQCLFHSKAVRNVLSDDPSKSLKQLVGRYENRDSTALDCTDIREQLGSPFDDHSQQDPVHYLQALATKYPSLQSLLTHNVAIETLCDVCKVVTTNSKVQLFMTIKVPEDSKSLKMDDLITLSQQYTVQDAHLCSTCNVPVKMRSQITGAKQIVVLKLDVWTKGAENGNVVRRKASITSAQNSTIKIEDKSFILQSSVHLVSNKSAGFSYASIIRVNNKWVHVNNHVLSHECWPKGAKNLFLAFYEQVSLSGTKQRKFKQTIPYAVSSTKAKASLKRSLPQTFNDDKGPGTKKPCFASSSSTVVTTEDWGGITSVEQPVALCTEWADYRYFPVDEAWQREACRLLNLRFVQPFQRESGGPDVILTLPDTSCLKLIGGDGNCLFRAMCFIITGSESQHYELRSSIIAHMFSIPELLTGRGADGHRNYLTYYHGGYHSVEDYLNRTSMAEEGTWGTDFEMCLLAHMLGTVVYSYKAGQYWIACFPRGIDHASSEDVSKRSLYIYYTGNHFNVVTKVLPRV